MTTQDIQVDLAHELEALLIALSDEIIQITVGA